MPAGPARMGREVNLNISATRLQLLIVLLFLPVSPGWLGVWLGMALIFAWTHRADLAQRPRLRRLGGKA